MRVQFLILPCHAFDLLYQLTHRVMLDLRLIQEVFYVFFPRLLADRRIEDFRFDLVMDLQLRACRFDDFGGRVFVFLLKCLELLKQVFDFPMVLHQQLDSLCCVFSLLCHGVPFYRRAHIARET